MMRLGQISLLCLLFALSTLVTSSPIKEYLHGKAGDCPPQRYYIKSEHEICHRLCEKDSECTGAMKCCPDNCHMMCKPPAQEKTGSCPDFGLTAGKCNYNCTSDSECPNSSKCCPKICGKTCVPTVSDLAKPSQEPTNKGFCPQEEVYLCAIKERVMCDDSSCLDGYKCCPKICRVECQKALEERAGSCPAADTDCPAGTDTKNCLSDYNCQTFYKCCSTKCGKKCIKAENVPSFLKEIH
ncbi:uncharacterized protein LOC142094992 [Mixophyes fleayi]|uniref:uncharacterized protein LOC142094992 n=1 Tax=Mixophyes fleayi TaxID=3061075 RepID=UPI003F4DFBB9